MDTGDDTVETVETTEAPPERVLAECWADFTKALSIYPETNVRVRAQLDGMIEAHGRSLEAAATNPRRRTQGVPILFRNGMLVLDDEESEIPPGSSLAWLQARLDRASLAGLEFLPGVEAEALIEFTKRLLAIYLRRDGAPDFESLWPHGFAGLVLIDRRFEGHFGTDRGDAPFRGGHAGRGALDEEQRALVSVLLEDEAIANPLARLEARVSAMPLESSETVTAAEVIHRIVQYMPADAMKDRDALIAAVRDALEALESRLVGKQPDDELSELNNDMTLSTLLYSVSRTHFMRAGPEETRWAVDDLPETMAAKRKIGHAGDEKIDEDVDAFLAEWSLLPADLNVDLSLSHAEVQGEEAAVLLHYLVRTGSKVRLEGLYPILDKVLEKPGREVLDVLRNYLQAGVDEGPDAGVTIGASTPVLDFLRRTNRTSLLRACGVFRVDWVVKMFPQYFILYLESLNPRRTRDNDELNIVCEQIGSRRMLRAMGPLLQDGTKVNVDTLRGLLAQPNGSRMALARLFAEWQGGALTKELSAFLRKIDLDMEEAFLVRRIQDARFLTLDYLKGLLDLHLGRTKPARVHLAISDVLCRHIRGTRESDARSHVRIANIKSLADYPSANSWYMLQELSRWSLFKLRTLEPSPIRKLARSVRRDYKAA